MSDHMAHMMNASFGHEMHHNGNHTHHNQMNHSAMEHSQMDHTSMGHMPMDHSSMGHDDMAAGVAEDPCPSSHSMHSMTMAFHGGFCETVLFEQWKVRSMSGLIGSMIGIMIMAALYEGLKYYREYLFWKTYNALQYRSVSIPAEKNVVGEDSRVVQPTMISWMHTFQTILHIIQIVLSYFLMLIFMTYNVWLCFAVVFGAALGYFLFGWKKSVIVDVTEHCH